MRGNERSGEHLGLLLWWTGTRPSEHANQLHSAAQYRHGTSPLLVCLSSFSSGSWQRPYKGSIEVLIAFCASLAGGAEALMVLEQVPLGASLAFALSE